MEKLKNQTVNPELVNERKLATFDVKELTLLIDQDEAFQQDRKQIEKKFCNDPNLPDSLAMLSLSPNDFCWKSIKTAKHFEGQIESLPPQLLGSSSSMRSGHIRSIVFPAENPLVAHALMFVPLVHLQGTEEQQARWVPLIENHKMYGSYAQTELGHGSNMKGLETTATYDPEKEEFIINSPTVTSVKCWPGGLGRTSNFAVVIAQLYSKNQCHGLHAFMVQLRSLEDHSPLPGITMGDLGPKMGLAASDNGFARFNNVRIPRENMLMKSSKVLKDGTYIKPAIARTGYGALILMRVAVVSYSMLYLAQACTISVRYSGVRRQGIIDEEQPEVKILDYQTQQYRLLPQVALSYAWIFTFQKLRVFYAEMIMNFNSESLAETHALTSGLKALSSHTCSAGAAIIQQACGGVGYLLASRLPDIYSAIVAACTYEGDNTILFLQTARYLIKSYKMAEEGKELTSTVKYLQNPITGREILKSVVGVYVAMYQQTIINMLKSINNLMEIDIKNGKQKNIAWDDHAIELARCAYLHSQEYVLQCIHDFLHQTEMTDSLKSVLNCLFVLLADYWVSQNANDLILYADLTPRKLNEIKIRIPILLKKLRPNSVPLVDAFDFCDASLHSIIGCYDGNVYERIYSYWSTLPENKQQFKKNPYLNSTLPRANL